MESDMLGLKATLHLWNSQMAQTIKNLLAMQESWVQSLGWEDPLEKTKATHSNILAWGSPWTIQGRKESDMTERLSHTHE